KRLVDVADRDVRGADAELQVDVVRILLRGAAELLERLLDVARLLEELAALEGEPGVLLVDRRDLVERLRREIELVHLPIRDADRESSSEVVRILVERRLEVLERFVVLALRRRDFTERALQRGRVWQLRARLLDLRRRLGGLSLRGEE